MRSLGTTWNPKPGRGCILLVVACIVATGCYPTPNHRTTFAPGVHVPTRLGAPLEDGHLLIEAELNTLELGSMQNSEAPKPGDSAIYRPRLTAGASIYGAESPFIELGIHVRYANFATAVPNFEEVEPFPTGDLYSPNHLLTFGAGLRGNIRTGNPRLHLSVVGEFNFTYINDAVFNCGECDLWGSVDEFWEIWGPLNYDRNEDGELSREEVFGEGANQTSIVLSPSLAMSAHWRISDELWFTGSTGLSVRIRNYGFPSTSEWNTRELWHVPIGFVAAGIDWRRGLLSTGSQLVVPIPHRRDNALGPALVLRVGLHWVPPRLRRNSTQATD